MPSSSVCCHATLHNVRKNHPELKVEGETSKKNLGLVKYLHPRRAVVNPGDLWITSLYLLSMVNIGLFVIVWTHLETSLVLKVYFSCLVGPFVIRQYILGSRGFHIRGGGGGGGLLFTIKKKQSATGKKSLLEGFLNLFVHFKEQQ